MTTNPATTFVFNFQGEAPLRLNLFLPEGGVTALGLLPSIFQVADTIHERSIATLTRMGKVISCGPGCDMCCHQLVPISYWEAVHLAQVIRQMEPARRSRVVRRFTEAVSRLDQADLLAPLNEVYANRTHCGDQVEALKEQYWNLKIPCPFLEENSCSIHSHRPLVCRQYSVTSKPEHCAAIYSADQAHEVVLHAVDAGGALAAFSGEGITHSRVMPLVFSLLAERSIRSESTPILPAQQMMGRFLHLLAGYFCRKDECLSLN